MKVKIIKFQCVITPEIQCSQGSVRLAKGVVPVSKRGVPGSQRGVPRSVLDITLLDIFSAFIRQKQEKPVCA